MAVPWLSSQYMQRSIPGAILLRTSRISRKALLSWRPQSRPASAFASAAAATASERLRRKARVFGLSGNRWTRLISWRPGFGEPARRPWTDFEDTGSDAHEDHYGPCPRLYRSGAWLRGGRHPPA